MTRFFSIQVLISTDRWQTVGIAYTEEEARSCLEAMKRFSPHNTYRIQD